IVEPNLSSFSALSSFLFSSPSLSFFPLSLFFSSFSFPLFLSSLLSSLSSSPLFLFLSPLFLSFFSLLPFPFSFPFS
ncbi:hypothetical protein ACXWRS_12415, partial [Streptococcus pyogenes]